MVNQVLFGEHFKVLSSKVKWSKIRLAHDKYEGWICNKQILEIEIEDFFNFKLENQIKKITSRYKFSFSQEIKLKKILHKCNLNNKNIIDLIKQDFKDSDQVIKKLEKYIEDEI